MPDPHLGAGLAGERRPPRLGLLAGSDLAGEPPWNRCDPIRCATPWGSVPLRRLPGGSCLILRHGAEASVPPHRIAHRAHLAALRRQGVEAVIAFCSVGSLRLDLPPGSLVVVDDWIEPVAPSTFHEDRIRHVTPRLDPAQRNRLLACLSGLGLSAVDGGVYWQSHGPRLETRAEVRMLSAFADVVGMTFGHEATLACEAGLPVAALCSVDNYAHGLPGAEDLAAEAILARKAQTAGLMGRIAARLVAGGAEEAGPERPGPKDPTAGASSA